MYKDYFAAKKEKSILPPSPFWVVLVRTASSLNIWDAPEDTFCAKNRKLTILIIFARTFLLNVKCSKYVCAY